MKIFQFIRRHPKKLLLFSSLLGIGAKYGHSKYEDECLMRDYCNEATRFGEEALQLTDTERHVTVILNPAANDGKCKVNYEKYCAPLLHLAGLKVALVRTEHEGQAKEIMNIMENTSAIIVAGGDGTVSEVLTGLLRRDDAKTASAKLPLGILPLGGTNSVASSVFGFSKTPKVKHYGDATMAIIKNIRRSLDVMEIQPIEVSGDDGVSPKSIYAAAELEWGAFRDTKERKIIYWYWAFLKKYMVYVFSSYKDLAWDCSVTIHYAKPCSGCSRCHANKNEDKLPSNGQNEKPPRWWQAFLPRTSLTDRNAEKYVDYSSIDNDDCGKLEELTLESISDVKISTKNISISDDIPGYALRLQLGSPNLSTVDYIKEGWHREFSNHQNYDSSFIVGELIIEPNETTLVDKTGEKRQLNIDNDAFEVKPMKIIPKPNAVTIFAPKIAAEEPS